MAGGASTGSVRVVRPGRCPVSAPCPDADVAVCGSVVAAAWGPAAGSVRVVRPGRCPAAGSPPVTLLSWEFGPGTRSPMDSMAVSSRRLRRRALRLRPVRVMVLPVIWAPTVVRKGPRAAPAGRELSAMRRADSWRMVSRAICCLAASAWVAHWSWRCSTIR
jgi:hypothetical protein